MLDINNFDQVFYFNPQFHLSQNVCEDIISKRRELDGRLFVDKLFNVLHVKANKLYPPYTNKDLRALHQSIVKAKLAEHHKQSLLFYILKDCRHNNEVDHAETFAKQCYLPEKYYIFIQGIWELDRLNLRPALEFLTAPTLIPTFPEDILSTLLDHAHGDEEILPLAYFQTVQPAITTPAIRRKYFQYLAKHSITEAYYFLLRQPEYEHRPFLELLVQEALHSKHQHQHSEDAKAQKALELIELPLTEEEDEWLESYLLEGKGRNLHGAKDTVTVRRMATGKTIDALNEAKHLSGRRIDGVSWDGLKEGMGRGAGRRKDMQVFKMP